MRYVVLFMIAWAQNNVGIGTSNPSERLHIAGGTLRIENLSGTGTALVETDYQGVLNRKAISGNTDDILRGDGTWGPDPTDWNLLGNSGTNPSTHFIGTQNAQPFAIGVNNTLRWRILDDGRHLIGNPAPASPTDQSAVTIKPPTNWQGVYAIERSGIRPAVRATIEGGSGPALAGINTDPNGSGILGVGSQAGTFTPPTQGAGIIGIGRRYGVVGVYDNRNDNNPPNDRSGGVFGVNIGGTYYYTYVGGVDATGTARKIWGSGGTPSTIVASPQGTYHHLFCPEAPDIRLEDYGKAYLTQKKTFIPVDSFLQKFIIPPLTVTVQPWADVAVQIIPHQNQGFWVLLDVEPQTPIRIDYRISAQMADLIDPQGNILSHNQNRRFFKVPDPEKYISPFRPVTQYLEENPKSE
ncbi:MAG: hypothetical protein ACUVRD_07085 [Bacteroidia bacterium]